PPHRILVRWLPSKRPHCCSQSHGTLLPLVSRVLRARADFPSPEHAYSIDGPESEPRPGTHFVGTRSRLGRCGNNRMAGFTGRGAEGKLLRAGNIVADEEIDMSRRSGLWEQLHPDDLEAILAEAPVAYVPLGTSEHHGWHLPVGFDGLKAYALCQRVAEQ